jgi:hypothetical protein
MGAGEAKSKGGKAIKFLYQMRKGRDEMLDIIFRETELS